MKIDKNFWRNKKILITGHTGFKGCWLSIILNLLGCKVSGYALSPTGINNFFKQAKVENILDNDIRHDIKDIIFLKKKIKKLQPDIIVHLAAQSSVIESFKNPRSTVMTNTIGTYNLLEAIKDNKKIKCVLAITTDKVYQNYEDVKYFDENSKLGGDDIYSGSKACCEILVNSYRKSFFQKSQCRIATARAGNCFGGGDWTEDRIVKDALECFSANKTMTLRNPEATRPWQHVIEPLFGYLLLIQKLCSKKGKEYQGPWNFGPSLKQNLKVINLTKLIKKIMNSKSNITVKRIFKKPKNKKIQLFESKHLNINSAKASKLLKWAPFLTIKESVHLTTDWYKAFKDKKDLLQISESQILNYIKKVNLV